MELPPCTTDPDLWFGYCDDDSTDGTSKARVYQAAALTARTLCLRRCPLAQQRRCARYALEGGEAFGVWAGIKLPGNQWRQRRELDRARAHLRRIAAGEVTPREIPENDALLRRGGGAAPAQAIVFHLPVHRPAA